MTNYNQAPYGQPQGWGYPPQQGMPPQGWGAPPVAYPPPVPQSPSVSPEKVADLEAKYAQMVALLQTKSQFPTQQRAGVIRYPNRIPFPMTLTVELRPSSNPNNGFYATTNEIVRGSINLDVENPTFLRSISANLRRPNSANNLANAPAQSIGVWCPLSAFRAPYIDPNAANQVYIGRDFQWRMLNASNSRLWQDGWKSSDQMNNDSRVGYVLPVEYECSRNDVLVFEAQPIGIPYAQGQEQDFVLEIVLHIYKMVMPG